MAYLYDGKLVEVIRKFSNHVIIREDGITKTVNTVQLVEVKDNWQPVIDNSLDPIPDTNNEKNRIRDEQLKLEKLLQMDVDDVTTDKPTPINDQPSKVSINTVDAPTLASSVKGIGKISSQQIIKNRPADGYSSFDELVAFNDGLKGVNWDVVKPYIVFD